MGRLFVAPPGTPWDAPGWTEVTGVPSPRRGGTFLYCPWMVREVAAGGGVSVTTCGVLRPGWATGTRFRTARAYRRHWRQQHA